MIQNALDDFWFATKVGTKPKVVSISDRGEHKKSVFIKSIGIGPEKYRAKLDNLKSSVKAKDSSFIVIKMTEEALPNGGCRIKVNAAGRNKGEVQRFPT